MIKGSPGMEQRIVRWLDEDITIELDVPEVIGPQLALRLQRRHDVEWLGIIRRAQGASGALGRLKATGTLVEVFGRSVAVLRPSIAAAVSAALDEELRALLRDLAVREENDKGRGDPAAAASSQPDRFRPLLDVGDEPILQRRDD